jgi:hypothetical protein
MEDGDWVQLYHAAYELRQGAAGRWWSVTALTLVSIMSLAACRDGRKAETLDRATALVLLRETPARSYRGLYWSAPLSVFVVGPAEGSSSAQHGQGSALHRHGPEPPAVRKIRPARRDGCISPLVGAPSGRP